MDVGADVAAQSRVSTRGDSLCPGGCGFALTQPAYAIVDVRLARQLLPGWEAALRINNLLDKTYFDSINEVMTHYYYGAPRSFALRIDGRF